MPDYAHRQKFRYASSVEIYAKCVFPCKEIYAPYGISNTHFRNILNDFRYSLGSPSTAAKFSKVVSPGISEPKVVPAKESHLRFPRSSQKRELRRRAPG
jgi:hypothetical protein